MDWLKRWGNLSLSTKLQVVIIRLQELLLPPSFLLYYNGQKFFDSPPSFPKSSSKSIKYLLRKKKIYCLHVRCEAAFRIRKVTTFSFITAKWIKYLILCMALEGIMAVRTGISRLQQCASTWVLISLALLS